MHVGSLIEPGQRHHDRENHIVFVLANAESHGLSRVPPKPYTCDCGAELTPEKLDDGDETKSSWPSCKSWRNGGRKKCPDCDEYPSIGREQYIRARGYEPTPKAEIQRVTDAQREETIDEYDGHCILCERDAKVVKRMVQPRYGGNRELENLAPLCDHHSDDYGHMFADIFCPEEWHKVRGLSWENAAHDMKEKFRQWDAEPFAEILDDLLEEGQPPNPYPYIGI